jgi:hypothetical protein
MSFEGLETDIDLDETGSIDEALLEGKTEEEEVLDIFGEVDPDADDDGDALEIDSFDDRDEY